MNFNWYRILRKNNKVIHSIHSLWVIRLSLTWQVYLMTIILFNWWFFSVSVKIFSNNSVVYSSVTGTFQVFRLSCCKSIDSFLQHPRKRLMNQCNINEIWEPVKWMKFLRNRIKVDGHVHGNQWVDHQMILRAQDTNCVSGWYKYFVFCRFIA